jgi:excinuclease ABC subunit B
MAEAARTMDYEQAARLRDQAVKLRAHIEGTGEDVALDRLRATARKSAPRHGRGKR